MVGETINHYRVLEELGGGAMGVVYKAQDLRLKRLVALKFLPPDLTRDEGARRRFVQEAEAASALDHPNVCTIHDIDTTHDGRVFIAMAFYDGETLKKRIQRGPLPLDAVVRIGRQDSQLRAGSIVAVEGIAEYAVEGGRKIWVKPAENAPTRNVRLFLLGSVMGLLLHQRGDLPLHANAIEIDGKALAFAGPSGSGKSTLAGAFHDRGYRVIADDVCVVRSVGGSGGSRGALPPVP